jgi:hypothetical protein
VVVKKWRVLIQYAKIFVAQLLALPENRESSLEIISVGEPEPRAEEPEFNCLLEPEPEPKLQIAALANLGSFLCIKGQNFMVGEEVFVKCCNFNPVAV